jgi:hypothetical protein
VRQLQPRVLRLELPQPPDVVSLQAAKTLPPSVERLPFSSNQRSEIPGGKGRYSYQITFDS